MYKSVFAVSLMDIAAIVVAHFLIKWMERFGKRK